MELNPISPAQFLRLRNHHKRIIINEDFGKFKIYLENFLRLIADKQREDKQENDLRDFLLKAFYESKNYINKVENTDWAIYHDASGKENVAILIEVKSTTNLAEMMSRDKPNAKALHELVLYYLQEKIEKKNVHIKHLIATNIYDWYIFDEKDFEKFFFTPQLRKAYADWKLSGKGTADFYQNIAKKYIDDNQNVLNCTYFDIKRLDDAPLKDVFKVLSPEFLLKQAVPNDANKLNAPFYNELLYILGIEERKDDNSNKKVIERLRPDSRREGSLLENTINQLETKNALNKIQNIESYGDTPAEQIYSVALELCITWLNRLLFMKLLEGQIVKYHAGNRRYKFLTSDKIQDYDELGELFFDVLAKRPENRRESVQQKFGDIPYLNSSLFEESDLETQLFSIELLKNRLDVPLFPNTILKDDTGKTRKGNDKTLHYLLDFMDAYDFGSYNDKETKAPENTTHSRTINAAVLGLIFEKLNGYRDGSFFTPAFITMYMCRETIRRAVISKLSDGLEPHPKSLPNNGAGLESSPNKFLSEGDKLKTPSPSLGRAGVGSFTENEELKTPSPSLGRAGVGSFDDLKEHLDNTNPQKRQLYNDLINNIRICDPAVGSGHFLVSALNEIIAIKAELGILQHPNGSRQRDYKIYVENDELIVWDEEREQDFQYLVGDTNIAKQPIQLMQETLFYEKRTIIENCLFGVDINPKSVAICQLRLWIELLKNAFYIPQLSTEPHPKSLPNNGAGLESSPNKFLSEGDKLKTPSPSLGRAGVGSFTENEELKTPSPSLGRAGVGSFTENEELKTPSPSLGRAGVGLKTPTSGAGELQTLPNIDINIKCGNSLVSKYALDVDLSEVFAKQKFGLKLYRDAVAAYKDVADKNAKAELQRFIREIKEQFRTSISNFDPDIKKLKDLRGKRYLLDNNMDMFGNKTLADDQLELQKRKLDAQITELETSLTDRANNRMYKNSFEWRFEFPEVLDDNGNFIGFDVVVGNPPYFSLSKDSNSKHYKTAFTTFEQSGDIYALFYELGSKILKQNALLMFITGSAWLKANYGKKLRAFFAENVNPTKLIDFSDCHIFDEATVLTTIVQFQKTENQQRLKAIRLDHSRQAELNDLEELFQQNFVVMTDLSENSWVVSDEVYSKIRTKIDKQGIKLKDWNITINRGILTGLNDAFYIDEATKNDLIAKDNKSSEVIVPMLRGRDITAYTSNFQNTYLVNSHNGENIIIESKNDIIEDEKNKYVLIDNVWEKVNRIEFVNKNQVRINRVLVEKDFPEVYKHFSKFQTELEIRGDKGNHWTNLRNCAYMIEFEKPKIIYPNMTKFFPFMYDEDGFYTNQKCYIMTGESLKYLVAFFNSKLFKYCFTTDFPELQGNTRELNKVVFEQIKVKQITKNEELPFIELVDKILTLKKAANKADTAALENEINEMVMDLYELTAEEKEIVRRG